MNKCYICFQVTYHKASPIIKRSLKISSQLQDQQKQSIANLKSLNLMCYYIFIINLIQRLAMKTSLKSQKTKKKLKIQPKQKSVTLIQKAQIKKKTRQLNIAHQQYLNQKITLKKNSHENSSILKSRREIASAMNFLNNKVQSKQVRKRPGTALFFKKNTLDVHKLQKINVENLVTEEDIFNCDDDDKNQINLSVDTKAQISYIKSKPLKKNKNEAATLIQKMWRGYLTRKLVKYNNELYKQRLKQIKQKRKKLQEDERLSLSKASKQKKTKKLSDIVKLYQDVQKNPNQMQQFQSLAGKISKNSSIEIQEQYVKTEVNDVHPIEITLNKLKNDQLQKWNEIISLINLIPKQEVSNNFLLNQLLKKTEENKNKLQLINKPIDLTPIKPEILSKVQKPTSQLKIVNYVKNYQQETSSNFLFDVNHIQNPFMKIFDVRLKVLNSRENLELSKLVDKLKSGKITNQQYLLKKQRIDEKFQNQRKEINHNKSQICFGVEKAHQAILNSKKDADFLFKVTGKSIMVQHSLSSQSLFQSFFKNNFILQQTPESTPCNSIESLKLKRRILTELESPRNQTLQNNFLVDYIQKQARLTHIKHQSQKIQQIVENYIIQQLCEQLYLQNTLYNKFQPYVDVNNTYTFLKVQDQDILKFIDLITTDYLPSYDLILDRLNQKTNPTPLELLKLLRYYDCQKSQQDLFYELVIPEEVFKKYRDWSQSTVNKIQIKKDHRNMKKFDLENHPQLNKKIIERDFEIRQKKHKIAKFQRDLQDMYYKAVFNCFNEYIIEIKSNNSPINTRSTIGPGELSVSLLDSNVIVQKSQIGKILQTTKKRISQQLKFKCPFLNTTNYNSLYNFQQSLTKQIKFECTQNEYKWINYYDEILELSMQLTLKIQSFIIQEAIKQLFK